MKKSISLIEHEDFSKYILKLKTNEYDRHPYCSFDHVLCAIGAFVVVNLENVFGNVKNFASFKSSLLNLI
jgi:hypothetical protein